MASSPMRARGVLPACALLALVALVAFAPAAKADDDYDKKGYDAYKECKYKYKGDDCYSPEAKDKCVKAYCDYDSYGKKLYCKPSEKSYCETYDKCKPAKCEYGKCKYYPIVCKSDNPCKESKCKDGYCVEYKKRDNTTCDDDYKKNKCINKKCKDGYCVEEKKKCDDYDYYKYDKECVKKEAYCDEYKGCVKAEYYEDGYECDTDYNKCTEEKCYRGKCKKVSIKKCKDDRDKYDKECVKKWAYCDKDYGCKETELYGEGYKCYKYYGKKKYDGYCNKWGKCEVDRKEKKDKYDDDKKNKKKDY